MLLAAIAPRSAVAAACLIVLFASTFGLVAAPTVRGTPTVGGDFSLALRIHGGEATIVCAGVGTRAIPRLVGLAPMVTGVLSMQIRAVVLSAGAVAGRLGMMMGSGIVVKGGTFAVRCQSAATTGLGSLPRIPFVSVSRLVRGAAAFAGDAALFFGIHCGKSSIAIGHGVVLLESQFRRLLIVWYCPRNSARARPHPPYQEVD
jgi:hypothetical protein